MTAVLDQLGSPRILQGTRADIWADLALDGEASPDPTGPVSVTVTDEDGNIVAGPTIATIVAGACRVKLTLTAAQTALVNRLTASWSGIVFGTDPAITVTTQHEVVGAVLFTLTQARAHDQGAMKSDDLYPSVDILRARDRIADSFGSILGFDFGTRCNREVVDGVNNWHDYSTGIGSNPYGVSSVWVSRGNVTAIRSAAVRQSSTWVALTATQIAGVQAYPDGEMASEAYGWPVGRRNVRIVYEAGLTANQIGFHELRMAALKLLRAQIVKSDIPSRYLSVTNQDGNAVLASPGMRGSYFGLPEVDEVLHRLSKRGMGLA